MKGLAILGVLLLLGGCGSIATLEQLEAQAMLTGDWSAVERRERIIAKRRARDVSLCPQGAVALCTDSVGKSECSCVRSSVIHTLIGGR